MNLCHLHSKHLVNFQFLFQLEEHTVTILHYSVLSLFSPLLDRFQMNIDGVLTAVPKQLPPPGSLKAEEDEENTSLLVLPHTRGFS